MKKTLIFCALLFAVAACDTKTKTADPVAANYMSGEFVYLADAANFFDCATGVGYPLSNDGAYLQLEQAYTALQTLPGKRVFVELYGRVDSLPGMEEGTIVPTLVVDSLRGFDSLSSCDRGALIAGLYSTHEGEETLTLHLKTNYSMVFTRAGEQNTQIQTSYGKWGRASATEVVLEELLADGKIRQTILQLLPQQEALIHKEGEKEVTFSKVYI